MTQVTFDVFEAGNRAETRTPLVVEVNRLTIAGWAGRDRFERAFAPTVSSAGRTSGRDQAGQSRDGKIPGPQP